MGKTKHKKRHRHGDEDRDFSEVGSSMSSSGIKITLKLGAGERHKKKKRKKEKKEREKERKHRHHHKEKRFRDLGDLPTAGVITAPEVAPLVLPSIPSLVVSARNPENSSTASESTKAKVSALTRFLEYLLKMLQKKDVSSFFSNPVQDQFAPGYSQIIKQPMDFSTMRKKLVTEKYPHLSLFKKDLELICANAMTYNKEDTIYYKSAKKLLQYGRRLMSAEKIRSLRNHLSFIKTIPPAALGFDVNSEESIGHISEGSCEDEDDDDDDDDTDVIKVIEDIREVVRRPLGRFEAIPDDLTSQEILDQASKAAKGAADRLRFHRPSSKMGFLRQKPDGTTSLSFLIGEPGVVPGTERERPVLLGSLLGKVKQGIGSIQGFREDRRNVAKAIYPLYYGAYSSHGPTYDSTFANLTKEETDQVFSTYGDNVGVQYAESILDFSKNCDYAMFIVDHLLDILTGNEHRKTSKYIEQGKKIREDEEFMDRAYQTLENVEEIGKDTIDFEAIASLSEEGIDLSYLDSLKREYEAGFPSVAGNVDCDSAFSEVIKENAHMIDELKKLQYERLSANPPSHFSAMSKPDSTEQELAASIRSNLVDLSKQVQPSDVVSREALMKILGANNLPVIPKTCVSPSFAFADP